MLHENAVNLKRILSMIDCVRTAVHVNRAQEKRLTLVDLMLMRDFFFKSLKLKKIIQSRKSDLSHGQKLFYLPQYIYAI